MPDSHTPETQALLPVTAADVDAALATFDGGLVRQNDERNARGYTTFYHPKDSMRAVLEEFSARQSSSNAGGVDARAALERAAEHFQEITQITAGCATSHGDDGGGLQMSNAVASEGWNAATAALASLSTPTAEPTPTPDRIGKDAVREALERVRAILEQGRDGASQYRQVRIVAALNEADRALSATPAQEGEGDD